MQCCIGRSILCKLESVEYIPPTAYGGKQDNNMLWFKINTYFSSLWILPYQTWDFTSERYCFAFDMCEIVNLW